MLVAEGRKHRTVCREAVFRAAAEGIAGRGIAAFSDMSVTDKGVTVTLKQSIVNGAWGYVSFLISGYELPEGAEPMFETADLTVEGWGDGSGVIGSGFDDGLLTDGYKVVGENGQEPETEEDGSLKQYLVDEDGNLEYIFDKLNYGQAQC